MMKKIIILILLCLYVNPFSQRDNIYGYLTYDNYIMQYKIYENNGQLNVDTTYIGLNCYGARIKKYPGLIIRGNREYPQIKVDIGRINTSRVYKNVDAEIYNKAAVFLQPHSLLISQDIAPECELKIIGRNKTFIIDAAAMDYYFIGKKLIILDADEIHIISKENKKTINQHNGNFYIANKISSHFPFIQDESVNNYDNPFIGFNAPGYEKIYKHYFNGDKMLWQTDEGEIYHYDIGKNYLHEIIYNNTADEKNNSLFEEFLINDKSIQGINYIENVSLFTLPNNVIHAVFNRNIGIIILENEMLLINSQGKKETVAFDDKTRKAISNRKYITKTFPIEFTEDYTLIGIADIKIGSKREDYSRITSYYIVDNSSLKYKKMHINNINEQSEIVNLGSVKKGIYYIKLTSDGMQQIMCFYNFNKDISKDIYHIQSDCKAKYALVDGKPHRVISEKGLIRKIQKLRGNKFKTIYENNE